MRKAGHARSQLSGASVAILVPQTFSKSELCERVARKTDMNRDGLLDYQRDPALLLAASNERHGVSVDASEMGVGKTYTAAALIRHFDEPTLVVCPLSVAPAWRRAGELMGVEFDIINYEKVRTGTRPYYRKKAFQYKGKTLQRFNWDDAVRMVVFDECHRCNGATSLNSKLLIRAKAQGKRIHLMSGTLAASPLQMKALGFALNIFDSPLGWWDWTLKNGCYKGRFGHTFTRDEERRLEVMDRINRHIFPDYGIRLRTKDLPGFPECAYYVDQVGLPKKESEELERLYAEMKAELSVLNGAIKPTDNAAVAIMRQRQLVELMMVPGIVELMEDGVASGSSAVVFVNFRNTAKAIAERLNIDGLIWGDQSPEDRERFRREFQEDKRRQLVCVSEAGGLGIDLHDIRGQYPRLALHLPGWSAVTFLQALRRVHRAGGKSKAVQRVLLPDVPSAKRVARILKQKLDNLSVLSDGITDDDLLP